MEYRLPQTKAPSAESMQQAAKRLEGFGLKVKVS
jgi:hypothetical protein